MLQKYFLQYINLVCYGFATKINFAELIYIKTHKTEKSLTENFMTENDLNKEFIVTARKWRPNRFSDVVGQEHVTTTIINAIKNSRIHHAYLFSGPRGVGKTTTARILARAVNCLNPQDGEPCNKCEMCLSILDNRSLDVIEIDGASNNSVDDVRKLRENAKYPPTIGKYKLYVIDEVHMLSTSAFNALLKTLEEPPPHLLFVFATTESHKVPATIISRCQRFDFRRMEIEGIAGQLKFIAESEGISIDEESLITIAKKADGSMRDGQSIFDQVVAFCGKNIIYSEMADALNLIDQDFFFRISKAMIDRNVGEMFAITKEVLSKGYDLQECLQGLLEHFRNFLTVKITGDTRLIESSKSYLDRYHTESELFSKADLLRILHLISSTEQSMRYVSQPRIRFELALIQLASMDSAVEIAELIKEVKAMKSGVSLQPQAPISPPRPQPAKKAEPEIKIQKPEPAPAMINDTIHVTIQPERDVKRNHDSDNSAFGAVDADSLKARWGGFLDSYATSLNRLTMLRMAAPIFMNGEVVLQTADKFSMDNLRQQQPNLEKYLYEFYGSRVSTKVMVSDKPVIEVHVESAENVAEEEVPYIEINKHIEPDSSFNKAPAIESQSRDLHPVEKTIIDLFGARMTSSSDNQNI